MPHFLHVSLQGLFLSPAVGVISSTNQQGQVKCNDNGNDTAVSSSSLSSSWQPPGKDTGPSISLPLATDPGILVKNSRDIVAADTSWDNAVYNVRIER